MFLQPSDKSFCLFLSFVRVALSRVMPLKCQLSVSVHGVTDEVRLSTGRNSSRPPRRTGKKKTWSLHFPPSLAASCTYCLPEWQMFFKPRCLVRLGGKRARRAQQTWLTSHNLQLGEALLVAAVNNIYSSHININTGRREICSEEKKSSFCAHARFWIMHYFFSIWIRLFSLSSPAGSFSAQQRLLFENKI